MRTAALAKLVCLALSSAPALAQGGGFAPGELILYRYDNPNAGGLWRIDPLTGQAAAIAVLPYTYSVGGAAAYDPFRDRVVVLCALQYGVKRVYSADAGGALADLGIDTTWGSVHAFAPVGDGRIYYARGVQIEYVDALGVERVVLDAVGAQPFSIAGDYSGPREMIYDAGENALFTAYESAYAPCPGGSTAHVNIYKLPLSAAGDRVAGPVACAQHVVSPGGFNRPVGWSRGPAGCLMLAVDSNTNEAEPRLLTVDPATLSTAGFASNGPYVGAAALMAGAYSTVRSQAMLIDWPVAAPALRAFSVGESGTGTIVQAGLPFLAGIGVLFEVPPACCGTNGVELHCTAKTTSGGCIPSISTVGGPMLSAAAGFVITATQVEAQKTGIFFYGRSGPLAAPFQGGFLCVAPPVVRTPLQGSGGSVGCEGRYAFDFLDWLAAGSDPMVVVGTQIDGQFWFRDPPSASTTGLSGGVEWTMCP